MIILKNTKYEIVIQDDRTYTAGSADNIHSYEMEYFLDDEPFRFSSRHSITVIDDNRVLLSCILLASGGASGIHEHSALVHGASCIIAVGPFMCSLHIPSLELEWKVKVDMATCFGVYYSTKHDCLISHGELGISRVDHCGKVIWKTGGADIFTNGFELHDDYIEVVDFNGKHCRIDIQTGAS